MSNFKPQVTYMTQASLDAYYNASPYAKPRPRRNIVKQFDTYVNLKKELKEICEANIDEDYVSVVRSRRGQWGEWFEHWKIIDGKPTIIKEGWN